MARKEKYNSHIKPHLKDITKWISEGETEYSIYEKLGINRDSWYKYKGIKPELIEAIKKGEQDLTKHIESMLYKRCNGFEYEETKTLIEKDKTGKERKKIEKISKKALPSDTAIIFALKNLNPDKWKDRQEFKGDINQRIQNITIDIEDDED
jgi:hypothetical protein